MIKLINARKTFHSGSKKWSLGDISLSIKEGERVALIGRSGSGKSTLLHMIGALSNLDSGEILINKKSLKKMNLNKYRNQKVGFIFQDFHLFPEFSLAENVAMPLIIKGMNRKDALKKAEDILEEVELLGHKNHLPYELSGGQRQRGAIARALINNPDIILADEPTGNLDAESGKKVVNLLNKIHKKKKHTLILATHDEKLANMCDRKIHLIDGKL